MKPPCYILDCVEKETDTLPQLFTNLGYGIKIFSDKENLLKTLDAGGDENGQLIVVFVDESTRNGKVYLGDIKNTLNNNWRHHPKLLIHQIWNVEEASRPSDMFDVVADRPNCDCKNLVHITSNITVHDAALTRKNDSLFVQAVDAVFMEFAHRYDIYELLSKVQKEVEIKQYLSKSNIKDIGGLQTVTFTTNLDAPFMLEVEQEAPAEFPEITSSLLLSSQHQLQTTFGDIRNLQITERNVLDTSICRYRMDAYPRGNCVIINIANYRSGAMIDVAKMEDLFHKLHFEIHTINNRTHEEIQQSLSCLSESMQEDPQCLVIILMAHGTSKDTTQYFMDVKGVWGPSNQVYHIFDNDRCQRFKSKPKIFVQNMCRTFNAFGDWENTFMPTNVPVFAENHYWKPMTDHIKLFSTSEGERSLRNESEGTLLITAIDDVFRSHASHASLQQMLLLVTAQVMERSGNTQQPEFISTMRGEMYFNPTYINGQSNVSNIQDGNRGLHWLVTECVTDGLIIDESAVCNPSASARPVLTDRYGVTSKDAKGSIRIPQVSSNVNDDSLSRNNDGIHVASIQSEHSNESYDRKTNDETKRKLLYDEYDYVDNARMSDASDMADLTTTYEQLGAQTDGNSSYPSPLNLTIHGGHDDVGLPNDRRSTLTRSSLSFHDDNNDLNIGYTTSSRSAVQSSESSQEIYDFKSDHELEQDGQSTLLNVKQTIDERENCCTTKCWRAICGNCKLC